MLTKHEFKLRRMMRISGLLRRKLLSFYALKTMRYINPHHPHHPPHEKKHK
jgi:hypothetical protein